MHAVEDVHDTPWRRLSVAPVGLGVDWIDHAVPFHASTSVTSTPELLVYAPTALHVVEEVHDTLYILAAVAPVGAGAVCSAHVVPFQRSTRGTTTFELLT